MRPLKKREEKYKETSREGLVGAFQKLKMKKSRQKISKKGGRPVKLFPNYKGPFNPSDGDPGETP